jgi:hypothetical protein
MKNKTKFLMKQWIILIEEVQATDIVKIIAENEKEIL